MVLVSFWEGFGIVLGLVIVSASFWDCFRIVFGSVRDRLGSVRAVFGNVLHMIWHGFGMVLIWFRGGILRGGLLPIAYSASKSTR